MEKERPQGKEKKKQFDDNPSLSSDGDNEEDKAKPSKSLTSKPLVKLNKPPR